MKFTELKDSLKEGAKPVYLLQGEDAYFRLKGEELLKNDFLRFPELNYSAFDGEELKGPALKSLVSALKSYPYMAEKRIVKVTEFYPSESDFETYLKPLFEDFPSTAILIIANSAPTAKKSVNFKRKKIVAFVDCDKAEPETVTRWVYVTFKRAGFSCSVNVAEKLAEYCLYDMARVDLEVRKIMDFKGAGNVTMEDIEELVYKDADYKLYEMTNAVSYKDFTKYCTISKELKSKNFDELSILNNLCSYFRNLISAYSSTLSDAQFAIKTNSKEYAVKKNREQAARIGIDNLKIYESYIYSSISDIKNGLISPASALQNCENTIFFGGK